MLEIYNKVSFNLNKTYTVSKHLIEDRDERYVNIKKAGLSLGDTKDAFLCKSDYGNDEIHVITNTGFIVIINKKARKIVTFLCARNGQLERYYNAVNEKCPEELIALGKKHLLMRANQL